MSGDQVTRKELQQVKDTLHEVHLELKDDLNKQFRTLTDKMTKGFSDFSRPINQYIADSKGQAASDRVRAERLAADMTDVIAGIKDINEVFNGNGKTGILDRIEELEEAKQEAEETSESRRKIVVRMALGVWSALLSIGSAVFLFKLIG